jgi:hypothetical protein
MERQPEAEEKLMAKKERRSQLDRGRRLRPVS